MLLFHFILFLLPFLFIFIFIFIFIFSLFYFYIVVMMESRIQLFVKTKSWDARRVGRTGRHLLRSLRPLAQHNCLIHTHLPVRPLMTCTLRYTTLHIIYLFFLFFFVLLLLLYSYKTD